MPYTPPQEILERYASVLVNFALGGGEGVKPGEVVRVVGARKRQAAVRRAEQGRLAGRSARDRRLPARRRQHAATSHATSSSSPSDEQLDHFPARYMRGLVDEMDHQVSVIAESDPHALDSVDPARIMRRGEAMRQLLDWRGEKENAGRFTWTLGLYGTPAMAAEAGMSAEEYWEQIIHACFLDERGSAGALARGRRAPGSVPASASTRWRSSGVHIEGEDVDLQVSARRAAPLARRARAQHPQLRDLHQPRLARHRGLDLLQPAALPLRQPGQGRAPEVPRRARDEGQRRGERAGAEGDDRHRGSGPDRRVLAHRPALLADHALHGPHALRRERRRRVRQHPHRGRPLLPGRLHGRPERAHAPSSGRSSASTTPASTPTSSRRPTASSPPRCETGHERVIYRDGEFQLD